MGEKGYLGIIKVFKKTEKKNSLLNFFLNGCHNMKL